MSYRDCPLCGEPFETNATGWAMCESCTAIRSGGTNLTPAQREVAKQILSEARNRGYNEHDSTACLATAIQESLLNQAAKGDGGKSHGVFQQGPGYPNRDTHEGNIKGFFDRLDAKRHHPGASPDVWKNIFWLQQRPSEPTAESAYTNGRHAYLDEIKHRTSQAAALKAQLETPPPAEPPAPRPFWRRMLNKLLGRDK